MGKHNKLCKGIFLLCLVSALQGSIVFAESSLDREPLELSGPLAIRNQMPLYLFYLQMPPDKAEVIERNKFIIDAGYTVSNITVSAFTPVTSLYDIDIDLEVSRVDIGLRYGVYDNIELGLELPYISLSSGYLDDFVENIEDGTGARTPRSRERQGSYEFDYSFRYNNVYLIRENHSTQGLGDIVLNAKYQLLKEKDRFLPNISIRGALKFPTAEKKDLLGSGELDYGFGLVLDKRILDRLFIYAGANVIFIEKPSFFDVLGLEEHIYSGMLAAEYVFTKRLSIITQVSGNSTPYPDTSTNVLDNEAYEFGIGLNYTWKEKTNLSWRFGAAENIKSASSPDVTFYSSFKWRF